MTNGFLRVAAVTPCVRVADPVYNTDRILELAEKLEELQVEVAVFPEMCITAYTCADLFHSRLLLDDALRALERITHWSRTRQIALIVGLPMEVDGAVLNCAAVVEGGERRIVAKHYLPDYNEFYERRWFAPAPPADPAQGLIHTHGVNIGVEICEDLWVPVPPSCSLAMAGAEVVFNLSASNDLIGKYSYLLELVRQQSARCICGYAYASAGQGESTTDLVFTGKTLIAEKGAIIAEADRWDRPGRFVIADIDIEAIRRDRMPTTKIDDCARACGLAPALPHGQEPPAMPLDLDHRLDYRHIDRLPFVPHAEGERSRRCEEIVRLQTAGLTQRLSAIGCRSLVVGISGGLDSTLALLIAVRAFDALGLPRTGITGVTMPGFGTTDRTHDNSLRLMRQLGVTEREVSIVPAVMQHFADIGQDPDVHDVTYENSQARERTQILMDLANRLGGIVLGTGDLSELALGWATYNGDHMSMYGVNAGVPKTLVRHLVEWVADTTESPELAETLRSVAATPISPELTPATADGQIAQRTEDIVGPYELHDFFLYYTLRYGFAPSRIYYLAVKAFAPDHMPLEILRWLRVFTRRFFSQQFKRSCMPDGPKVGSVCLSPRGDWRMPSDASSAAWLADLDRLEARICKHTPGLS